MERFFKPKATIIIADGDKPPLTLAENYLACTKTVVALDGAVHWLLRHKLKCDLVVGDFDSARRDLLGDVKVLKVDDQNSNDLEKALHYCKAQGLDEVVVLGAYGKRSDHFLTNIFVMKKFAPSMTISLVDHQQCIFICPKQREVTLDNAAGSFISLFPLAANVGPIWSNGVQYPLSNEVLSLDTRIGTLNQIIAERASIYCESDHLLIATPNLF
ncbi:MAG TPA: thiamine diphosphokinase [Myxococcota bacterium]|nr:thiamine diphosphokinase [Myxococcota bacterium]